MTFHVLNWGLGVESSAILLLWIFFPSTRPFKHWNQLIIVVAQTGDESPETKYLCETYILPLLRSIGVRLVQAAKHGASKADGYTLLADTCEPYEIHTEGDHKLSDNMLTDGWVPRVGRPHICAMRWKGEVLDVLIGDIIYTIQEAMDVLTMLCLCDRGDRFAWLYACWLLTTRDNIQIGPYLGYNAEELGRMKDAQDYGCHGAKFLFPLIDRGLTRDDCIELIYSIFRVIWRKSCCVFCPFQKKAAAIAHYQSDPQAAVFALWVEFNALAMNSRMKLFERYGMQDICRDAQLDDAIAQFEAQISHCKWAVYHVRRIYRQVGNPQKPRVDSARKVEQLAAGTQEEMILWLKDLAESKGLTIERDSHWRCYSHVRDEQNKTYPAIEGFWVVTPSMIRDKCHRKTFDQDWRKLCLQQRKQPREIRCN